MEQYGVIVVWGGAQTAIALRQQGYTGLDLYQPRRGGDPMDAPERHRITVSIERTPYFSAFPDRQEIGRHPSSVMEDAALRAEANRSIV